LFVWVKKKQRKFGVENNLGDFVRILKKEGGGKRKRSRTGCWREN
jgi:hypothetical protein